MSGLKINVEKTRAIWIGSLNNSNRQICREYNLDWTQGPFKILVGPLQLKFKTRGVLILTKFIQKQITYLNSGLRES